MAKPPFERFMDKVQKTDYCWLWKGYQHSSGYGGFKMKIHGKQKTCLAHRVSWFLEYGDWTKDLVLHHCDNKECVNPLHLFTGTQQDNINDMWQKGRANPVNRPNGENAGLAKITNTQAEEIRLIYSSKTLRQVDIGKIFGIGQAAVSSIVRFKTYNI
jgi:predicted XRE-type DNA-binding protein